MDVQDVLRPSVVEVSDVEATTAFFEAFSFRSAGTYSDANSLELRLLKRDGRSGVLVLVRKSTRWSLGGCSTVTLLSERVREEARSAVNRGARLIVSQRAAIIRDGSQGRASAPSATVQDASVDAHGGEAWQQETEAGIACLEGPDGVRVLLIDRRLVGPETTELPVGYAIPAVSAADAGVSVRGSAAGENGARAKRQRQVGSSSSSSSSSSSPPGGVLGEAVGGASIVRAAVATTEAPGTRSTSVHPLLLALAALSSRLSPGQSPRSAASAVADPPGRTSSPPTNTERGLGDGVSGFPSDGTGEWFSEDELREEDGFCAPRKISHAGANQTEGQSKRPLLAEGGLLAASSETAVMAENGGCPSPSAPSSSTPAAESAPSGGRGAEGVSETTAVSKGGEGSITTPVAGQGAQLMEVERPFPELEVSNLGNLQGSQRITPNSFKPFPIDNDYFTGAALLLMKRKPMDASYAHIFEGKNRMFEVQVQGRFKKIPEGDLYVSLEITEKMQLGLLTKGICRVMLSFGQRMNKRLHYSFGTDDNSELPHIAFPLVSSVNSLIRTADGEPVPVLGKPFEESEESRAQRRRMDVGDGFGSFELGYLYSFSLHSMYINIMKWSTSKLPMLRDIDLHTLWGNAALRITAYVVKRKPAGSASVYRPHLQSDLEYVFCIKVRHVREGEREARSEGGDDAAAEDERANALPARSASRSEGVVEAQRQAGLEGRSLVPQRRAEEEAAAVADRKQAKVNEARQEGGRESQTTMPKPGDEGVSDVDSDNSSLGGFATPPEWLCETYEEDTDSGARDRDGVPIEDDIRLPGDSGARDRDGVPIEDDVRLPGDSGARGRDGVPIEDDIRLPGDSGREPVAFLKQSLGQASTADERGRDAHRNVNATAENDDVAARARGGNERGRAARTKETRTSRLSRSAGSDAGEGGKMIKRDSWTGGWFLGAGFGANPATAGTEGAEKLFAERASTDDVLRWVGPADML